MFKRSYARLYSVLRMFVSPSSSGGKEGNSPKQSGVFLYCKMSLVVKKRGISLPRLAELKARSLCAFLKRTSFAASFTEEHSCGMGRLSSKQSKSEAEPLYRLALGCFADNADIYVSELLNIGCAVSAKDSWTCISSTPVITSNSKIVEAKERKYFFILNPTPQLVRIYS